MNGSKQGSVAISPEYYASNEVGKTQVELKFTRVGLVKLVNFRVCIRLMPLKVLI